MHRYETLIAQNKNAEKISIYVYILKKRIYILLIQFLYILLYLCFLFDDDDDILKVSISWCTGIRNVLLSSIGKL